MKRKATDDHQTSSDGSRMEQGSAPKRQKTTDLVDQVAHLPASLSCSELKTRYADTKQLVANCLTAPTETTTPAQVNLAKIVCDYADVLLTEIDEHLKSDCISNLVCHEFWMDHHPSVYSCEFCEYAMVVPDCVCDSCDKEACLGCSESDVQIFGRACGHNTCEGCAVTDEETNKDMCRDCFQDLKISRKLEKKRIQAMQREAVI